MLGYDAGASGSLVGEYDGAGNLIQETVWLGDIPVATIRPSGSSVAIYYIESDQLDTPRAVIRPSDNTQMWTWFSGPFGLKAPNENPQGIGTFVYDLRFPGQVAGAWGSAYQNYFRDYDPAVGRYVEPDPIGLDGRSFSTYAYAGGNPISWRDKIGLQAWLPGMQPPADIPGGPWSQAAGQLPGDFWGPKQPKGGRAMCRYVPDENNGGPPGAENGYWKTQSPGQNGWNYYDFSGNPSSPDQLHAMPGDSAAPNNPSTPLAENPYLWALLALFYSKPAF